MALFLREDDIALVLRMSEVITAVEDVFRQQGLGKVVNRPRQRVSTEGTILHVMSAAVPALGVMGLKAYSSARGGMRFLAMLYSTETGDLLAVMEANRLGQIRTGAASAVATKYLARPDAGSVGIIGTGWQARSQLVAVASVRPIALVKCYGRDERRRTAFADEMIQELGAEVAAVDSAEEAVEGTDIIITATSSRSPVIFGSWLQPGLHVNAIGSNWGDRRELDADAIGRAGRIVVDDLEQAKVESGDLIGAVEEGAIDWTRVVELGPIVAGTIPGRTSESEISLFESQGIALEDVAAMKLAYDRAREMGVGEPFKRNGGIKGQGDKEIKYEPKLGR
ncbi:MAG: ornithine cyclodeaminase family protein [bacterium]